MNVLFEDGKRLGRRLLYDETYVLGKFDPNSEAFQFYKPIDSIWGDFETRETEETAFSKEIVWNPEAKNRTAILKGSFANLEQNDRDANEKIYIEQLQTDRKKILSPALIHYKERFYLKDINEKVIDLAQLGIDFFDNERILGVAFILLKTTRFNPLDDNNRTVQNSYHIDVRIVKNDESPLLIEGLSVGDFVKFNLEEISITRLLNETTENILRNLPDDFNEKSPRVTTTVINPVLVIHKDAISQNRNFTGKWEPNKEWDFMGGVQPKRRMVLRLGMKNSRYILFLHGDKEANDPTGIPST
jgi:hypothetical protein